VLTDAELADARAIAATSYTATLTIHPPNDDGGGGWDPEDGPTPTDPDTPLYQGPARIQATRNSSQPRDVAAQPVTVRPYKIAIPYDAPDLPVGARATVNAHPSDAHVIGKVLTVTEVVYGDLAIERVFYASLDLTNQPTGTFGGSTYGTTGFGG